MADGGRIASLGPAKCTPAGNRVSLAAGCDDRAIRQFLNRAWQRVQPLASMIKTLSVQHRIHFRREHLFAAAFGPGIAEGLRRSAPAKEARRCPAASATASSRKNSSVQLRPPITVRRRPLNSQRHASQALLAQRFFSRVRVAGSWMMPRLPVKMPRCGMATMSPNGVTRFCNGIRLRRPCHRSGPFIAARQRLRRPFRRIIGHGAMRTEQLRGEGLGLMLR